MIRMFKIDYRFTDESDNIFYSGVAVHSSKCLSAFEVDRWMAHDEGVVCIIDDGTDVVGVHDDIEILEAIPY